jgi:hypothetical protein
MSRNARRIALSLGTAAGAALIAVSISMGTAPVAGADVLGADAVSDLIGASAAEALPAVGATDADPLTDLVAAFDPNAFTATGAPTDVFGLFAYYTDTYLLGPSGLGDALDPGVDTYLASLPTAAASVLDADPVSDLTAALDPSAFNALGLPDDVLGDLASGLDADLLAPLGLGALLDPVIDGLVGSATLF